MHVLVPGCLAVGTIQNITKKQIMVTVKESQLKTVERKSGVMLYTPVSKRLGFGVNLVLNF